jgi:hypothetical protein
VATFRFASRSTAPLEFRAADDSTWFSLAASGTDALGAPATLALEVRIGNRRPVVETFRPSVQATHRFDPAAQAYLAEATLSSFSDPDGDPLEASSSSGDAACGTVVMSGTDAQARCRLAFPGLSGPPPLASFATNHPMTLRVSDGWEVASAAGTIAIQNAMPTARPTDGTVQSCYCNCRPTTDGTGCIGTPTWAVDTANVPLRVDASEPDGDPVQVTVTPSTWVAAPVKTVLVGGASAMLVNPVLPASYTVTIDDGVSKVTTTSRVTGVTCSLQGQVCQP